MPDLLQSARMFEASSKMQSACAYLQALADGKSLDEKSKNTLKWVGKLLPEMDWDYTEAENKRDSNKMAFEATSARPAFYASLVKLDHEFNEAGLDKREKVSEFLKSFYELLLSGGTDEKLRKELSGTKLGIASKLLSELAHSILRQYASSEPKRPELFGNIF